LYLYTPFKVLESHGKHPTVRPGMPREISCTSPEFCYVHAGMEMSPMWHVCVDSEVWFPLKCYPDGDAGHRGNISACGKPYRNSWCDRWLRCKPCDTILTDYILIFCSFFYHYSPIVQGVSETCLNVEMSLGGVTYSLSQWTEFIMLYRWLN